MRNKKDRRRSIPTPKPPRRVNPPAKEQPPGESWLSDEIDPKEHRYKQMVTAWVRNVTKEQAIEWLLHVPDYQRNKKASSLRNFEADMREGYWIGGAANIVFDNKGDLINGQHVLSALVASDLPEVECIVVVNRHPNAYLAYDLGMRRSLADNLKGETDHPGSVGKILNVLAQWDKGVYAGKGYVKAREGSMNLNGRRGRELLLATPGITPHIFPNPFKYNRGYRSVAAMHAASYRLHQIDPDKAKEFFECFLQGTNLNNGHPVLALRKRLTNMDENERLRSGPTLALILAAWNVFVTGEKVTSLPFKMGQPFPEVATFPFPVPESSRSSKRVH